MYKYIDGDVVIQNTLESGEDIVIKDNWKKEHHFKLATFELPAGLIAEAIEVKKDFPYGYYFKMMFDFDTDPEIAKERLINKMKRGLNRRHLKKRGGTWKIGDKQILRGRIEWNDDYEDTAYDRVFVIDGKRITMENFSQMFEEWEGWHFEFRILDPYDENT